jgi:RHS repeat-associated protein
VEENSNTQRTPYLFTAKELDEETGLYYFGARYYDPRTSVWQSADPILGKYLPSAKTRNSILPGQGGVYNTFNLGLYSYAHQNPVRYTDPDGKAVPLVVAACVASNACMAAVAATVVLATNPQAREALGKSMVSAGKAAAEGVSAAGERIKNLIFNESSESDGKKAGEAATGTSTDQEIAGILEGATPGRETKGRTEQFNKPGGRAQAEEDFGKLPGEEIPTQTEGVRVKRLPDGRVANIHDSTKPGAEQGKPTVEIQQGKDRIKIRYDD